MTTSTLSTTSSGLAINGGDTLNVTGGGAIISGSVNNAGVAYILSGGSTTGTSVNPGGTEYVYGGTTSNTIVAADTNDGLPATQTVASGGVANDTDLVDASVQTVVDGGTAVGTIVGFVSELMVSSGGVASGALISGEYASEVVFASGSTVSTTAGPSEGLTISSGGASTGSIASGGSINVLSGATATATVVSSGGVVGVVAGGSATGLQVISGGGLFNTGDIVLTAGDVVDASAAVTYGTITVGSGGTIEGSLQNGGVISLLAGATESGLTLGYYYALQGTLEVASGVTYGNTITIQGTIVLRSGEVWSGVTYYGANGGRIFFGAGAGDSGGVFVGGQAFISGAGAFGRSETLTGSQFAGAQLYVSDGGSASGTMVAASVYMEVDSGGVASATVLSGTEAEQDVSGGVAYDTVVNNSTYSFAYSGGSIYGTIVNDGGYQEIDSGGTAYSTTVNSGGSQYLSTGVASDTTVFAGGVQQVYSGGSAFDTVLSGGSAILSSGLLDLSATGASADSGSIVFSGGGVIEIDGTVAPDAAIFAFSSGGQTIDLTGIGGVVTSDSYSFGGDGDLVAFSGTAGTMTLFLVGAEGAAQYTMASDGNGGIDVTLGAPEPTIGLLPASDSGVPGDGITNNTDPTLTGTGVAGDTITLLDGTTEIGSGTVGLDGTWSITPGSALSTGTHDLSTIQQADGGIASGPSTFDLVIDTSIPAAPGSLALAPASDSGVTGDDITNVTEPAITGTGTAGDTVRLYDGETAIGTAVVAQNGTWTVTPATALADGPHTLTATQTGGNVSEPSSSLVVTIDTTAPAAPTDLVLAPASDSGVAGDDVTNVALPIITGTAAAGNTIDLYDGATLIGTGTAGETGAWSITATTALTAGSNILTARAIDVAGNLSAASSTLDVTLLTAAAAPTGLLLAPASDSGVAGDDITNVALPAITGTAAADSTVTLYDGETLIGTGTANGAGLWSITATTALSEGANDLTAVATDIAGNVSGASTALVVTLDTVAPAAPSGLLLAPASDSGVAGDDITNVGLPAITGTATPGVTVDLYDGETLIGTGTANGSGMWSITATTALSQGANELTATAVDVAGNASDVSAALVVTLDTAAPAAPGSLLLAPASDSGVTGDDITNVRTPTITGTAAPGATIDLYDGTSLVGTGTANEAGVWSIATTPLGDGAHGITAKDVDTAGNVSAASATLALTIDTSAPAAPTLGETVDSTNPAEPSIDGDAETGSTVRLYQNGTLIDTTTTAAGAWSYDYADALAAGTYLLTATATDAAGNLSAVSATMTLDVNSDNSYALVVPIGGTTNTKSYVYNSAGVLSTVDTNDANGLLLVSVSDTSALINIYDASGKLIGTIAQPSTSAFSQPIFATTPLSLAATTGSGPIGSVVNLLSENNYFVSQGNDLITVHAGVATIVATGSSAVVQNVAATITFYGGDGAASVYGGSGSVIAFGGASGGVLVGGSGGDNTLVAGGGPTTIIGGGDGDDLYGGTTGTDTIYAGTGTEILIGGGGDDTLVAAAGDDAFGGSGTSTLFASAEGTNVLVGGSGSSTLWGGGGLDIFFGNPGIDSNTVMIGGSGDAVFIGLAGTTTAYGGTGNDSFWVGSGAMTIVEGKGTDIVGLGSGTATITGGAGTDLYALLNGNGGGADTIANFKVGTDHIALQGYGADPFQQQVSGGNTVLSLADHSTVTLLGVTRLDAGSIVT